MCHFVNGIIVNILKNNKIDITGHEAMFLGLLHFDVQQPSVTVLCFRIDLLSGR